jgi:hypothetical protein
MAENCVRGGSYTDGVASSGLQFTWGDECALVWQPESARGGNVGGAVRGLVRQQMLRYHLAAAATGVESLHTPDGEEQVICHRVPLETVVLLGQLGQLTPALSPSAGWFGSLFDAATQVVGAGRVVPRLLPFESGGRTRWITVWVPLEGDVQPVLTAAAAEMPPVVGAAAPSVAPESIATDLLFGFVDGLARHILRAGRWRAAVPDTRRPASRAMRMLATSLTHTSSTLVADPQLDPTLAELSTLCARIGVRADGLPIIGARLRLAIPLPASETFDPFDPFEVDDVDDEIAAADTGTTAQAAFDGLGAAPASDEPRWPLTLEVFDLDDRSRWCTADDVRQMTPLAAELMGDRPAAANAIAQRIDRALRDIPRVAPWLADWAAASTASTPSRRAPHPANRTIDIDEAAATLQALPLLRDVDVELLLPESLSKRRPSSRGQATPNEGGAGRLGATALVQWSMVIDDQVVDEATLARAAQAGTGLIEVGGRWVRVDQADAKRALAALADHRTRHSEVSGLELLQLVATSKPADADAAMGLAQSTSLGHADDDIGTEMVGSGWAADLLAGLPEAALADGVVPLGFEATLRPYQLRGLGWLQFLHRLGLGGCLADDMGLGKTPTTLAHLAAIPGPHLVVCPLSVVRNWQREAAKFTPLRRVAIHHGTGRANAEQLAAIAAQHDIVITTYQVATRDIDALAKVAWSVAVYDEAQAMKNSATATARAMRKVPAAQRVALTGTPVENRLAELWSIFNVVVPGLLGSLDSFRRRFAGPIERDKNPEATARLRQLTTPFLLRRTKADKSLVPDLPDKVEQIAWAPLTREQATMYQAVVEQLLRDAEQADGMRRRGLVLAALTRLKQICNHPAHALKDGSKLSGRSGKLARFDELISDLVDAGEQALVFTQFREMGDLLQQHLRAQFGISTPFLHGGVPKTGRDRMVDQFQAGSSGSPLLLVSLKAGGTGLNLTAASRVVHYDRWWNPAVEDQATDRAWRIGQRNSVFVHKLVCQGTVEERVDALINDKRALADAVVGTSGEAWLSEMSTDQLRDLVMLDLRSATGQT